MEVTQLAGRSQLTITASHERTRTSGSIVIGGNSQAIAYDKASHTGYARHVRVYSTGETATHDFATAVTSATDTYTPPIAQSAIVTGSGSTTAGGTINLVITSNAFDGGTKTVYANVSGVATPSVYAGLLRTAANNSTEVSANFIVSGTGADIILTRIVDDYGYANDATFEMEITSSVIAASPIASSSLTSGSLATGVWIDEPLGVDAEGIDLPTLEANCLAIQFDCLRGEGTVTDGGAREYKMGSGGSITLLGSQDFDTGLETDVTFTMTTPPFDVVFVIANKIA